MIGSGPVLVAGIGNVFFGDDGFGVEVVRQLLSGELPEGVEVADYGIRGLHLAYRLLEPVRLLVVADAISRGEAPGTLYVLDPEVDGGVERRPADGHSMHLPAVLAAVRAMGGELPPVRIVGCEPALIVARLGLSEPVRRAVPDAAALVLGAIRRETTSTAPPGAGEGRR